MLSYYPIIKSLYRKYNTLLLSSGQFQSLSLAVGQLRKLSYLSTVRKLYLNGIRIGIGINSHQDFGIRIGIKSKKSARIGIWMEWNVEWNWELELILFFFGMTKGLHTPQNPDYPSQLLKIAINCWLSQFFHFAGNYGSTRK